ncbi:MAG TPA: CoA pyrophosphatase [Deltaproteobacteria bacterium]|nr:CoA pyrophosphatase [Deltaproteobacteria bacterium]HOM28077.1 CoA pyrophosphatase [Deltaproteobacteria bacterium]HPP79656.1 CoA pyrophosphatase [Deltaproteobacteria bacterium]
MGFSPVTDLLGRPDELRAFIKEVLARRERRTIPAGSLREAAVLVPLCWRDPGPAVLLTKRSLDVEHHKGEISFPGGRFEPGDRDIVHTALREAHEEIGLAGDDVDVLGLLDDHVSIVGYHITPVVGSIPYPYPFRINSESEALIELELARILDGDAWMAERSFFKGSSVNMFYLETDQGVVWGATARMLKHFADLLAGTTVPWGEVSASARTWVMNLIQAQGAYRDLR